ncbi:unnamed protein product [Ilex paraguariensis]|uniref:Protein NLP6-like n=1 Tax=Ilex paraguariensis TaxID=185542 RepID=A0ABC8TAE9_9AQUA
MSGPGEEKHPQTFSAKSKEQTGLSPTDSLLMMDIDVDGSWTFDQLFSSNPTSPCLIPNSDQPCSPLWAFSDDNDGKTAGNIDAVTENPSGIDDKRRLPLGLMTLDYPDGSCVIKEKMIQALRYFKDSTNQHVLAQVWAPVKNDGQYVLTTLGQPFVLHANSNGLHQYRMASLMYMFSVDGESDGVLGLPGRVFRQKLPEWTPNVQYYSSKEYARLSHALHYNVCGTLALPVFEHSGQSCVCVLELIMMSQKTNYAPDVDKVCKALEAVDLRSSEILDNPNIQICNEGRQNALAEILEILTVVCETHKFPLAQTWVPCRHRSVLANGGGLKKICRSFDGSCMGQVCMSTSDAVFYVVDARMWGFREACAEHHLQKGQGVTGRAFESRNLCFCRDVSQFCKTEYPLVHYARMFGLTSCFAICLRSTYTGDDYYILEFFLPPEITDSTDQQTLLNALFATMKQHLGSLQVASGKELEDVEQYVEIIIASTDEKLDPRQCVQIPHTISPPRPDALSIRGEMAQVKSLGQESVVEFNAIISGGDVGGAVGIQNPVSLSGNKDTSKKAERKRGKAEKVISLEVLQQYFAGSLKNAAKSLGVCPTTMKRICRQHGINRWPSRKINKVNRSISKLKRVIESVQCAEGAFPLTSPATSSLPPAVGSISLPSASKGCNQQNSPGSKPYELPGEKNEGPICKTPGSDGQAEIEYDMLEGRVLGNEKPISVQTQFLPELGDGSNQSKTGSGSREESTENPTSHGSCEGSPFLGNESLPQNDWVVSPIHEQGSKAGDLLESACQPRGEINLLAAFSTPDVLVTTQTHEPFGGMLIEDAGSSHDLKNLCPAGEALFDEQVPEDNQTNPPCPDVVPEESMATPTVRMPQFSARPEVKTISIKATYREDIIRFRLYSNTCIVNLKEEVAKRLKLETGTFEIKYLDDDHEWVLIACDADFEECVDISRSSGSNIVRLVIHDIMANIGSSCGSSGE